MLSSTHEPPSARTTSCIRVHPARTIVAPAADLSFAVVFMADHQTMISGGVLHMFWHGRSIDRAASADLPLHPTSVAPATAI